MAAIAETIKVYIRRRPTLLEEEEVTILVEKEEGLEIGRGQDDNTSSFINRSKMCSAMLTVAEDGKSCEFASSSSRGGNSGNSGNKQRFHAHHFFEPDSSQEEVFEVAAKEIVESVLQGYSGSILAYGPTGTGKTYTMRGLSTEQPQQPQLLLQHDDEQEQEGIIPRTIRHLLEHKGNDVELWASYVQIYCETVTDLLPTNPLLSTTTTAATTATVSDGGIAIGGSGGNLQIREKANGGGVYLEGVSQHLITSQANLLLLLAFGDRNRMTAATNRNETSSRSHAILLLSVIQRLPSNGGGGGGGNDNNHNNLNYRESRLVLVDLAGSERASASQGRGYQRSEEAKSINLSLSALGNVLQALAERRAHIPYRDSKLTRLLQDSLGQNSRTAIVVTVSSAVRKAALASRQEQEQQEGEMLAALRFAQRAMQVQVLAQVAPIVHDYEALYRDTMKKLQLLEAQREQEAQQEAKRRIAEHQRQESEDQLLLQKEQIKCLTSQLTDLQAENKALLAKVNSSSSVTNNNNNNSNNTATEGNSEVFWQEHIQSLRASHQEELQRIQSQRQQDMSKARQARQTLQEEVADLQATLYREREQLLRAMQDLRQLTERHLQQENYHKDRLAEVLQEQEGLRQRYEEEHQIRLHLEEEMKQMVTRRQVEEMERLFYETVDRLTKRVTMLERPSSSSSNSPPSSVVHGVSTNNRGGGGSVKLGLPPVPSGLDSRVARLEPGGRVRAGASSSSSKPSNTVDAKSANNGMKHSTSAHTVL
eukprot:scaffold7449_cov185-Ochromonas_danica.AAC.2